MKKYFVVYFTLLFFVLFVAVSCYVPTNNTVNENFDCLHAQNKIEMLIRSYKTSNDTIFLLNALPLIDTALKYCDQKQFYFENKISIYRWTKKYDKAIALINSISCENDFQYYWNDFGKNYQLMCLYILRFNDQNDTAQRDQYIRQLINDMKLSFDVYNNAHIDSSELNRLKCIPSVNPTKYEVLIDYYTIRMLIENKDKLLQEVEEISVEGDFKDYSLKNDLIKYVKNANPQNFYK